MTFYGYIYKVTCRVNGKGYIGQTTQEPLQRWEQHKRDAQAGGKLRFHIAMFEHGVQNFDFTVVDIAHTHEELNAKECKWIMAGSYNKPEFGYNGTAGGSGQSIAAPVAAVISEITDVVKFSNLKWQVTTEGYTLPIPEKKELQSQPARFLHEKLNIVVNGLSEHTLSISTVQITKQLGVYNTLKEAFESGDDVITRYRADRMALLTRTAEWMKQPASEPAKRLLHRLSGNKVAQGITAGECSQAINLLQSCNKKETI